MSADRGKNKKKLLIILFSVFGAVILALGVILAVLIKNGVFENKVGDPVVDNIDSSGKLKYDEAAVVMNSDDSRNQGDDVNNVEDGYICLSHKNKAISTDGENFECYILNGAENKYDLFVNIYKDSSAEEQVFLSGLIPPGSGLTRFKSQVKLEKGTYKALLVITQVEEDRKTMRDNQLLLAIDLIVQ